MCVLLTAALKVKNNLHYLIQWMDLNPLCPNIFEISEMKVNPPKNDP